MTAADNKNGEPYIVEFTRVGAAVKVTAIDPKTTREATILGPASISQDMLARQAVRKLERILSKAARTGLEGK